MSRTAAEYNAWYHTRRGAWIAAAEFDLLKSLFQLQAGSSLLDVGCGTGHFSRRFAKAGLRVTGIDPDSKAIEFSRNRTANVDYLQGDAQHLPFADAAFDYCSAVTSLCFIGNVKTALQEMWRVSRKGIVLGLLNRHSLLYREREQHPGYKGARWDTANDARQWAGWLSVPTTGTRIKTAISFPGGSPFSRAMEKLVPARLPFGAFIAVYYPKQ